MGDSAHDNAPYVTIDRYISHIPDTLGDNNDKGRLEGRPLFVSEVALSDPLMAGRAALPESGVSLDPEVPEIVR